MTRIPFYRHDLGAPEVEAFRAIEKHVLDLWVRADQQKKRYFPHEIMYQLLLEGRVRDTYQIDPAGSWLLAAAEKNLPIFVPGWEDSTLGNIFVSHVLSGDIKSYSTVKGGLETMGALARWYVHTTMGKTLEELPEVAGSHDEGVVELRAISGDEAVRRLGFFQIGGGIAGDFPICVVPMLHQDMEQEVPLWGYFCQISDSTTSYGSYSGAVPNEKITWGKLDVDTPRFVIESDATIVAPLLFAYVLGW